MAHNDQCGDVHMDRGRPRRQDRRNHRRGLRYRRPSCPRQGALWRGHLDASFPTRTYHSIVGGDLAQKWDAGDAPLAPRTR